MVSETGVESAYLIAIVPKILTTLQEIANAVQRAHAIRHWLPRDAKSMEPSITIYARSANMKCSSPNQARKAMPDKS
jgi:hypothetical protein